MANTTSGTHTFEKGLSIDEIIEESFEEWVFKMLLDTN